MAVAESATPTAAADEAHQCQRTQRRACRDLHGHKHEASGRERRFEVHLVVDAQAHELVEVTDHSRVDQWEEDIARVGPLRDSEVERGIGFLENREAAADGKLVVSASLCNEWTAQADLDAARAAEGERSSDEDAAGRTAGQQREAGAWADDAARDE